MAWEHDLSSPNKVQNRSAPGEFMRVAVILSCTGLWRSGQAVSQFLNTAIVRNNILRSSKANKHY